MAFGLPAGLDSLVSGGISAGISLLTADAYSLLSSVVGTSQWGLYLYGAPVVVADTVTSFDIDKQWTISNYPVENGAFLSYDKVYRPFTGTFRFTAGGSEANRQALLTAVEAISPGTTIYDMVTPEMVYSSVTVVGFSNKRNANSGVGLVSVDVQVEQVNEIGGGLLGLFQSVISPLFSGQVNTGPVKTAAPSASVPPATAVAPPDPITVTPI